VWGFIVLLDAGGEIWVQRQAAKSERLGTTPGLLKIGPRQAWPYQRAAQAKATALKHEAG